MKFIVRTNDKMVFSSEMFGTREEAEKHSKTVSFISDHYALRIGYPCGGFVALDSFNNPTEIHAEAA